MPYLFNVDYTKAQRDAVLALRGSLKNRNDGVAYTTTHLDNMRKMVLDLAQQLLDNYGLAADARETEIGLNVTTGLPNNPEYRHEHLVETSLSYFAAWAYDHSAEYAAAVDVNPEMMETVQRGRGLFPYREADVGIVSRSLLRHFLREKLETELWPYPVVGREAASPISRMGQIYFRGRNDDGGEATATWKALQTVNWTQAKGVNFRVRFVYSVGVEETEEGLQMMCSKNGGAYSEVNAASSIVRSGISPYVANGASVLQRLSTAPASSFVAGQVEAGDGFVSRLPVLKNYEFEHEFVLQLVPTDVVAGDTVALRAYRTQKPDQIKRPLYDYTSGGSPVITVGT